MGKTFWIKAVLWLIPAVFTLALLGSLDPVIGLLGGAAVYVWGLDMPRVDGDGVG